MTVMAKLKQQAILPAKGNSRTIRTRRARIPQRVLWPVLGSLVVACTSSPPRTENLLRPDAALGESADAAPGSASADETSSGVTTTSPAPGADAGGVVGRNFDVNIDPASSSSAAESGPSGSFTFGGHTDTTQRDNDSTRPDGGVSQETSTSTEQTPDSGAANATSAASTDVTSTDVMSTHSADAGSADADASPDAGPIDCMCPASDNPCAPTTCDPSSGECVTTVLAGATCDDGDPCTLDDQCTAEGACSGSLRDCSSQDGACVQGQCDPDSGQCVAVALPNDVSCNDGSACTSNDRCDGNGRCEGTPLDCSRLDGTCVAGECNPTTGACEPVVQAGAQCDDTNSCTVGDVCSSTGTCVGTARDCSELDGQCGVGVCDAQSGECQLQPRDGSCDDGDPCTVFDTCAAGSCGGARADTCQAPAPLDLSNGTVSVTMSTEQCGGESLFNYSDSEGEDDTTAQCEATWGPELYFELDLTAFDGPTLVVASTNHPETDFDTVVLITEPSCSEDAVLACHDDVVYIIDTVSELRTVLDPGMYVLIVDGFHERDSEIDRGSGTFRLSVTTTPCESTPETCLLTPPAAL